jgi:Flp pilus assembly protein TadD
MIRAFLLCFTATVCAAAPTFTRDVAPIIFENCAICHRPGQSAPFSLLTYNDVAKRSKHIAEVTAQRIMPPWLPDPAYSHFEGERLLTEKQIQTFADWNAAGAPEGNPADLPKAPVWPEGWTLGKPDLVVKTPLYEVPAQGKDVYRNFVVPLPVSKTQYVAGVEFDPGNRAIAHHTFMMLDRTQGSRIIDERDPAPGFDGMDIPQTAVSPDGHFLSWQPGKRFALNPDGMSWRLYPNSDLVLQMHMQLTGKPESIQSSVAFFFTDKPPTKFPVKIGLSSYQIDIPAGASNFVVTDSMTMPIDVDVTGILPHAHYLARDMQGYVLLPGGGTNWLIRIPDWNFNWQGDYRFKTPVFAPKGSTLTMRFTYDNSTNNPRNPHNPPVRVRYGVQTVDEMAELWLQVLPRKAEEMPALRLALEKRVFQAAIDYAEYRLRLNPNDANAHVKFAQGMLAQGKPREALPHLQAAAAADPNNDEAHYYLGLLARMRNLLPLATEEFTAAAKINPKHAKALGNLGILAFDQGDLAQAEKYFLNALEIEPNDSIAHDHLGVIYMRQQKLTESEKHLREAERIDPNNKEIKAHLAILLGGKK